MNCLLCGAARRKFVFNYEEKDIYLERLGTDNFRLKWFMCSNCGVYFSRQHRNIESIYADKDLYDAQYNLEGVRVRFDKIMRLRESNSDNTLRVKRIKDFYRRYAADFNIGSPPYRVLDIGAGLGVFLAKFLDRNYLGTALEVNQVAARHLKERLSIPVYNCRVEDLTTRPTFDLITVNRVIEHIKRPIAVLRAAKKILKPRGIIYLELPDSISYELCGARCDAFASGHYMVYNPESLLYLLGKSGFEVLAMARLLEPSGKHTIYAFARRRS